MIDWFKKTWGLTEPISSISESDDRITDNHVSQAPVSRTALDDIPIEGNSEFVGYVENCLLAIIVSKPKH